jgi:hypothetical protein
VLSVASGKRSCASEEGIRPDQRHCTESVRLDDGCGLAVFVEKYREGHLFILDECHGVPSAPGADCRDAGAGRLEISVIVPDLTGPLAAGQSAEVAEEQQDMRVARPQISQAVHRSFRIGQLKIRQSGRVECHLFSSSAKARSVPL